ncbi:MAG: hypothetical protein GOV02_03985 [Candidatus Aenigmarchaeota archaeon]|nr:hypothetical protein [Candidatus Aenigmarchaeota archaeon]
MLDNVEKLIEYPTENGNGQNGESRVERLSEVLHNEQSQFFGYMANLANLVDIDIYDNDKNFLYKQIPKVLAYNVRLNGTEPTAFTLDVGPNDIHVFNFFKEGMTEKNKKLKKLNIETKIDFEKKLGPYIENAKRYKKMSNDLDFWPTEEKIKQAKESKDEFDNQYLEMGTMSKNATRKALENGADLDFYFRVFDKDGSPFAIGVAWDIMNMHETPEGILLPGQVDIHNYDEGDKFGIIEGNDGRKSVYVIYRDFTKGWAQRQHKQAEVRQDHKGWTGIIFDDCPLLYDGLFNYTEKVDQKNPRIEREELEECVVVKENNNGCK